MKSGAQAEQTAARFLQQQGLRLVQANYRCRFGEIDLILKDGDTLVFTEVRMRSSKDFGGAAASIDASKPNSSTQRNTSCLAYPVRRPVALMLC